VATKKQILIPLAILAVGIAALAGFSAMKKPPEEKPEVNDTPIVTVKHVTLAPMTLKVDSYGMVTPKYETQLIAQVNGEIVELSDVFQRGGFVKKGQLLARIDPNDYQAALIDAQASMASARAALEKEVAQGKVAEREWKQITDSSPTELSLRKPQLAQELARVKAAQASVLRAERNLERTEIRSPYDAMIDSRDIGLGAFVSVGKQIGHLLATDVAQIRLPVADSELAFLSKRGVNAQVHLQGVYAGQTRQWQAIIKRSEGVVDSKSRMAYLVAEVQDPYQLLKLDTKKAPLRFGSYINAQIIGNQLAQATTLPRYLVLDGKVAILGEDSKLHYVAIDIIRQQGSEVIVENGLVDGNRLIISALDYPIEGMKLALETKDDDSGDEGNNSNEKATQMANNKTSGAL
jgi:RND family efflux transporter MFP subunit